jgi:hypothetical protein
LEGQPDEPFADPTLLAGSDGENAEGGGFIQRILTRLKTSTGADEDQNAQRLNRFLEPNENRR